MDDAALIRDYIEHRSEHAFRELVRRHLPVVYAAALRQVNGDTHLAEDVAQQVFISFARKASQLLRQPSLVGWLYTAARLEAARAVRTEVRRRRREEESALVNSPEPERLSFDQLAPVLDEAMSGLARADREAVLLRYFSGRSFGQIGLTLRISEDAARKRVDRALGRLQRSLRRRGVLSSAAALGTVLSSYAAPPVLPAIHSTIVGGACAQHGTGSAVSVSLLMSTTKALTVTAGLLAAAGVWYYHASRHPTKQPTTHVELTGTASRSRPRPAGTPNSSIQIRIGTGPTAAAARFGPVVYPHLQEILREHPEYAGVMRRRFERFITSVYEPAIEALKLSPPVAAKLRELLVEEQLSANDAVEIAPRDGIPPGSPAFGEAVTAAEKAVDAQIAQLIGPDGLSRLRAAQNATYYQAIVRGLSPALMIAGDQQLTPHESAELAQTWYATNDPTANPAATQPDFRTPDPTTELTPGDELLLDRESPVLSPGQLRTLRQYLKDQNIEKTVMGSYRHAPSHPLAAQR